MRTITILILSASALLAQTKSPASAPKSVSTKQQLGRIQSQEKAAEKKLAELRTQYTDSHPQVVEAKRNLAFLRLMELTANQALLREGTAAQAEQEAVAQRIRDLQQQMTADRIAEEKANTAEAQRARDAQQEARNAAEIQRMREVQQILDKASAAERLAKLKAAEADLVARMGQFREQHPDLARLKQELEGLQAQEKALAAIVRGDSSNPQARNITPEDTGTLPVLPVSPSQASQQPFAPTPLSPLDRWWRNNTTVQSLGLSADQQKRMDDVLQQYRLKLVDVNGSLQKEEIALEPLVGADKLDLGKITAQIDRVAQARAELEKVNGRMLLEIRKQLTSEQWRKLNQPSASGSKF